MLGFEASCQNTPWRAAEQLNSGGFSRWERRQRVELETWICWTV